MNTQSFGLRIFPSELKCFYYFCYCKKSKQQRKKNLFPKVSHRVIITALDTATKQTKMCLESLS